jgi:transcriptional regulator with XRE-family HTH domain
MIDLTNAQLLRTKIIGTHIRAARISSGKSLQECAEILGVSSQVYESYELGEALISLPELEGLAYFLKIPLDQFLSSRSKNLNKKNEHNELNIHRLIDLRQRMVGAQVRQARIENKISLEEFSQQVNIEPSKLEAFELGLEAIPFAVLESICVILKRSLREFQDQHSRIGIWFTKQQAITVLDEMEPDLLTFISNPINRPYLELAKKISELSTNKLRTIAEGILEITF